MAASTTGVLEVRVTDSRAAIEDFERLDLTLIRIGIRSAEAPRDEGWMGYAPSVASVNLADQIGGHTATVMRQEVLAGPYDAIRVEVGPAAGRLHDGRVPRLKVSIRPVRVHFDVRPGGVTSIVMDFTVMKLKDEPGRTFDYEVRIKRAFVDPPAPTHSGYFGPAHRESPHRDEPRHSLRYHLGVRGERSD